MPCHHVHALSVSHSGAVPKCALAKRWLFTAHTELLQACALLRELLRLFSALQDLKEASACLLTCILMAVRRKLNVSRFSPGAAQLSQDAEACLPQLLHPAGMQFGMRNAMPDVSELPFRIRDKLLGLPYAMTIALCSGDCDPNKVDRTEGTLSILQEQGAASAPTVFSALALQAVRMAACGSACQRCRGSGADAAECTCARMLAQGLVQPDHWRLEQLLCGSNPDTTFTVARHRAGRTDGREVLMSLCTPGAHEQAAPAHTDLALSYGISDAADGSPRQCSVFVRVQVCEDAADVSARVSAGIVRNSAAAIQRVQQAAKQWVMASNDDAIATMGLAGVIARPAGCRSLALSIAQDTHVTSVGGVQELGYASAEDAVICVAFVTYC